MEVNIEELVELKREKKVEYLQKILKDDDDFFKKIVLLMAMEEENAETALSIISEYRAKEWELLTKLKNGEYIDKNEFLINEQEDFEKPVTVKREEASPIEKIEEVQMKMEASALTPVTKESYFLRLINTIKTKFSQEKNKEPK